MDENIEESENQKFNYDFISPLDLIANSKALLEFILRQKIICWKCHERIVIKFGVFCITKKCECGCGILYPPRKDRGNSLLYKFVSKRQNDEFRKSQSAD